MMRRSVPRGSRRPFVTPAWGALATVLAISVTLAPAAAEPPVPSSERAFDPATGRSLLNYPPDRVVDYRHMRLDLTIPDMNTPRLTAKETLTFSPISETVGRLTLDAACMTIESVTVGGRAAAFDHDGEHLTIDLDPPVTRTDTATVVIDYTVTDPTEGLHWTTESPDHPGRAAQIHSQGEPESNHYWFPCHDFPNVRLTTEVAATVPDGYRVISNGRLVGRASHNSPATQTFHWLQDKRHAPYLVTLVVGKFDAVKIASKPVPMTMFVPPGQGRLVPGTYENTPEMVELFSQLTGRVYPWAKYDQVLVWNFGAGGMENTSATTLFGTAVLDGVGRLDGDLDGLISHELAHQWFGDLLTCKSWEHIWLNEGFATYFANLWFEHRDGQDEYMARILGDFDGVIGADHADAPKQPGMVSKVYSHPWDVFGRKANPYPKGSSILHMLRRKVGDDLFFKSIRAYVQAFADKPVETSDLRRTFERVTGLSLQRFFDQWCRRPGVPHLDVKPTWDAKDSTLRVTVDQTQNIDGDNPAFDFSLPIWVASEGGNDAQWLIVSTDERHAEASLRLEGEPAIVAVDPDLAVIAELNVTQPTARWINQLNAGPTIAAKIRAVRALADVPAGERPNDLLFKTARDPWAHRALRIEAIKALGKIRDVEDLLRLADVHPDDARIRAAIIEHLPDAVHDAPDDQVRRVTDLVRKALTDERSYEVRAKAVKAIAKLKPDDAADLITSSLSLPSQGDKIRRAALDALADLDQPGLLDVAIRYTKPDQSMTARAAAARAVGRLGHHDPEQALAVLKGLLDVPIGRIFGAAGEAIVELGDQRGLDALNARLDKARTDEARNALTDWIDQLKAKLDKAATNDKDAKPAEPAPESAG